MNLVKEIEEAAKRHDNYCNTQRGAYSAKDHGAHDVVVESGFWHRIKAALEAAEDLAYLTTIAASSDECSPLWCIDAEEAINLFRRANEGDAK